MSTDKLLLTTTPQLISTSACCIQSLSGNQFNYAFGDAAPSGTAYHRDSYIYYDGSLGSIWAWVDSATWNVTVSKV